MRVLRVLGEALLADFGAPSSPIRTDDPGRQAVGAASYLVLL